jgi:hypothetical protein
MICYLDVDGVMRDLAAFYKSVYPDYPDITAYYTPAFNVVWKEYVSDRDKAREMYVDAPVVNGAAEAYRLLRKAFGKITYLTANGKEEFPWLKKYTMLFLRKHGFMSSGDDIIFVDKSEEKLAVLKKDPGVLFDDKVHTILELPDSSTGVWVMNGMTGDIPVFMRGTRGRNIYTMQDMTGCDRSLMEWLASQKVLEDNVINRLYEEKSNV